MRVLVIGSGGREHALIWKLAQSAEVAPGDLFCAPGNAGTAQLAKNVGISVTDLSELVGFARKESIDLTVVGPEAPLCAGIQDRFAAEGLLLFGPSAAAAQLEGSKVFAKEFMTQHGIPTAPYGAFSASSQACQYIEAHPRALVVKADGLAAGKGVIVCAGPEQAKKAVSAILGGPLGAGGRVLIEERLAGEELSVIALCDGMRVQVWAGSQDHKAAFDGDRGPNTGGMGAYSPVPLLEERLQQEILERVLRPTIEGLAAAGKPYRGFLYAGMMIVKGRPQVLEFNCRLGDPEAQPLLCRFAEDLLPHLLGASRGELPQRQPVWDARAALCVVMASGGYPGAYAKGHRIEGMERAAEQPDVVVFHAGTAQVGGDLVTAGGRVLGVTALGETLEVAQAKAYGAVKQIRWRGVQYRTDIGWRGIKGLL